MEVILRQSIEKLGRAGEVVRVRPGYARNFLLPRKLAYPATPGNLKVIEQERSNILRRETRQRDEAERLRAMIEETEFCFTRRVGEHDTLYGSVTTSDIGSALEEKGFTVDRRKIVLEDQIKRLGEFTVPIRLHAEVTAGIRVRVQSEAEARSKAAPAPAAEAEPEPAVEADTE